MSKIRTQETGAGRDRVAKRENLPVDERATTSSSREKRADPRVSFRFVSFHQTEPSTKTDFVFVSAKVKTVRNRIVRGGPTNRERLSLIPFFLLFR